MELKSIPGPPSPGKSPKQDVEGPDALPPGIDKSYIEEKYKALVYCQAVNVAVQRKYSPDPVAPPPPLYNQGARSVKVCVHQVDE